MVIIDYNGKQDFHLIGTIETVLLDVRDVQCASCRRE